MPTEPAGAAELGLAGGATDALPVWTAGNRARYDWPVRPFVLLFAASCAAGTGAQTMPAADAAAGIATFNQRMIDATQRLDNAAVVALWEDDGVSLLPSTKPIVGKAAIRAFLDQMMAQLPGARVQSFEMTCTGLDISGPLATEYCHEHQLVDLGAGKKPFDGTGTILFVLHRGEDGVWRVRREMWNQG